MPFVATKDTSLRFHTIRPAVGKDFGDDTSSEAPGSLSNVLDVNPLAQGQGLDHLVPIVAASRLEAVAIKLVGPSRRQLRPQSAPVEGLRR